MTVPKQNISNTVLLRALPISPVNQTWPMLLNTKDGNINDQVELWVKNGNNVVPVPTTAYTIEIQNPDYWEFIINWTGGVQPTGQTLFVFRRTRGVVQAFTVGEFLSAEALNQRFDLDNLGINDTAYYQSETNPMYSKQAVANKGQPDTTATPWRNPRLPKGDLNLPYLGTGSPALHDIYTWGKKITNSPNPGDGEFEQVLIGSSSGGGTVAQLVAELANDTSAATAGGNMIGLWSAPNPYLTPPAGGWPGGGQTLESWFLKMSKSAPSNGTGATQIGFQVTGANSNFPVYNTPGGGGETSLQRYCDALHFFGGVNDTFYDSGASFVGYSGWGLNTPITVPSGKTYSANTVAGCLERLNKPATTPTASGAEYVKFWDTHPIVPVSKSVQVGLTELWTAVINSQVPTTVTVNFPSNATASLPFTLPAPYDEFANLLKVHIRTIALGIGPSTGTYTDDIFLNGTTALSWDICVHSVNLPPQTRVYLRLARTNVAIPVWTMNNPNPGGWAASYPISCELSFFLKAGY